MSDPSVATIKRLYAVSGNRCAFPKCPAPLVHGNKVTGRVCHIKGAKPGSARYDAKQSDAERHSFSNLILMCPIHHDVIDADELAYTEERLHRLKVTHESAQIPTEVSDGIVQQFLVSGEHGIANVYNQHVSSINQQGGITAHTVNVPKIQRKMGQALKKGILAQFPRDKKIVIWSVAGNEETHIFAEEIFRFMNSSGFNLFGNGPTGNVFLGLTPKGVCFRYGDPCNEVIVGYPDGTETPNGPA